MPPSPNPTKQSQARDLKHRVLTCLHKLSDRDTHAAAASELESISRTLPSSSLPSFLSSISATDPSDTSPVRRHCLNLISVLSRHHPDPILSPHLPKLLSAVVRRLRDPDSSVRSACVSACLSLSHHLTSPPFASLSKPFLDALFTEQDPNAQNGAALCLAAIIDGSENPDANSLRRVLPRLEKLAKSDGCKAKPAILGLVGSIVGVKGILGKNVVRDLVVFLVGFLSSDDWAARKAAAEALIKIAVVERDGLSEFKASCLKTFEAKRFDKVKAVRETMNQMIEAWKEIPDLPDEVSPPPESQGSSKENASDGRYPPGGKTPQVKKTSPLDNQTRTRTSLGGNKTKTGPAIFRKLDRKNPSNSKVEITPTTRSSGTVASAEDSHFTRGERVLETDEDERKQFTKPEIRRALFDEKQKIGVFKSGSRVVPYGEGSVVVSNETGDICRNQRQRDCDDRNQQSNLLDILQRFIGSSQNGMHSLETRVHGLELALDDISFDLALSTGRMSRNDAMCCKLPGSDFLSSKLWKKTESRSSTSRLPTASHGTPFNEDAEGLRLQNRRYQFQGGRGLIMNPLAEIPRSSHGLLEVSSGGVVKNAR